MASVNTDLGPLLPAPVAPDSLVESTKWLFTLASLLPFSLSILASVLMAQARQVNQWADFSSVSPMIIWGGR